jgi:uncharacterized protein (DUF1015 family)
MFSFDVKKSEIYIYRQSSANSYYTGIIAGASLDEFDNKQINIKMIRNIKY